MIPLICGLSNLGVGQQLRLGLFALVPLCIASLRNILSPCRFYVKMYVNIKVNVKDIFIIDY